MTDDIDTSDGGAPTPEDAGSNPAGHALFNDIVQRFVAPEVERRIDAGRWQNDVLVAMFQALLHEDGDPEVRLNDELGGMLQVKPVESLGAVAEGQEIGLHEIAGVSQYSRATRTRASRT